MPEGKELTDPFVNPECDVELEIIVDEMVRVAFAEKGSPPSKVEGHQKVSSVVGLAIVRGGLPLAAGVPRPDAIVGVVADDDGVVPGCLGEGVPESSSLVLVN